MRALIDSTSKRYSNLVVTVLVLFCFLLSSLKLSINGGVCVAAQLVDSEENIQMKPIFTNVMDLKNDEAWTKFLNSLNLKLLESQVAADVVKDIKDYDKKENDTVFGIAMKGGKYKSQELLINRNNLMRFWDRIADFNLEDYGHVKNMTITQTHLEELNHVVNVTLNLLRKDLPIQIECAIPHVFVKAGSYISIHDNFLDNFFVTFAKMISSNVTNSCTGRNLFKDFKFINIFALNTIVIMSDLNLMYPEVVNFPMVTFIAPRWHVIGKREINLPGLKGKSYDFAVAPSSTNFGENGKDGKPGLPGGPGGNFVGIVEECVNCANLTITSVGGKGGNGQHGARGMWGQNGQDAQLPSRNYWCEENFCDKYWYRYWYTCEYLHCWLFGCSFRLSGTNGMSGGNGGNGGRGGWGGQHGSIVLYELNNGSRIATQTISGKNGLNGNGGLKGANGRNGNIILATCKTFLAFDFGHWRIDESYYHVKPIMNYDGISGNNDNQMKLPEPAFAGTQLIVPGIINRYKMYARESLNDRYMKPTLTQFLHRLDSDDKVKNTYNTLSLVDELGSLEQQFQKLNGKIDMLPFYKSLLERTSKYADNPQGVENTAQYKKVLGYLYAAILGRIYFLQDHFESNLIVNITSHLDSVQEDLDRLKKLKSAKYKIEMINKYNQEYKNGIDQKIKEAEGLISKTIIVDIGNTNSELEMQIDSLINEVIYLQRRNEADLKILIFKREHLKKLLHNKAASKYMDFFMDVVSFLGKFGKSVSTFYKLVKTVEETLATDHTDVESQLSSLLENSISSIEKLRGTIKRFDDQTINRFKRTLEIVSQKLSSIDINGLIEKIESIKERLNKVDKNKFNPATIQVFENDLKSIIDVQKEQLLAKRKKGDTDQKTAHQLEVLYDCQTVVQMTIVHFDNYNKIKSNQEKEDLVENVIQSKESEFKIFKEFEFIIHKIVTPTLQNIQNDLHDVASKLSTKSKVALDVTNWQVQRALQNLDIELQQLTENFEAKNNLAHSIRNLGNGMSTLINVYNHIQDYADRKKEADLIADISSISEDDLQLGKDMRNTLRELEISVTSNIVLQRYQVAIDAMKQFVFPFAHSYLKELLLPSNIKLGSGNNNTAIEDLVLEATYQIEKIRSKLRAYTHKITNHDGAIIMGEFSSRYDSTHPFFIWTKEQYKNEITNLLSGQEIIVKADITCNSSPTLDALKFSKVELYFKAKTQTAQPIIDWLFKGFMVSMTHLGDSYYTYDNKTYLMTTSSQHISYYIEKDGDGNPVRSSQSYKKLLRGDFVLSPFATWKIKLINVRNKFNLTFEDLQSYDKEIDLHLEGYGYYVSTDRVIGDLMVEKYYKPIYRPTHKKSTCLTSLSDSISTSDAISTSNLISTTGSTLTTDSISEYDYDSMPTSNLISIIDSILTSDSASVDSKSAYDSADSEYHSIVPSDLTSDYDDDSTSASDDSI